MNASAVGRWTIIFRVDGQIWPWRMNEANAAVGAGAT